MLVGQHVEHGRPDVSPREHGLERRRHLRPQVEQATQRTVAVTKHLGRALGVVGRSRDAAGEAVLDHADEMGDDDVDRPTGARRHSDLTGAEDAGVEAGDDVSALVFEGHRWHRDEDVLGQQSHQRVEVGGLPRLDELRHDRLLGG